MQEIKALWVIVCALSILAICLGLACRKWMGDENAALMFRIGIWAFVAAEATGAFLCTMLPHNECRMGDTSCVFCPI